MFEYKLMASALVFPVTLTLTGSFLTIEDWGQQDIQQKVEIINTYMAKWNLL